MITDAAKSVKAEAYVDHISDLVCRKHLLEEKIAHKREELALTGVALGERVSTSPSMDAIPNGVAHILEMIEGYKTELAEYSDELDTFDRVTAQLTPLKQLMLYQRYVMLNDWDKVAKKARYSKSRLYEIHRSALIDLYPIMPEYWRSEAIPDALDRSKYRSQS